MNENGFRDGPEPSQIIGVCEGDIIEINYRVNIQNSSNNKYPRYVFNSNVPSFLEFYLSEVDQYLQRNFSVFRGIMELYRAYNVTGDKKAVARKEAVVDENSFCVRREKKKLSFVKSPSPFLR